MDWHEEPNDVNYSRWLLKHKRYKDMVEAGP
jgi:hypothetical protein